MNLTEGVRMGVLEIRTNKMRSFLSFLGVLFGVATVLLVLAILAGMNDRLNKLIELQGPGRMTIERAQSYKPKVEGLSKGITVADVAAVKEAFPELDFVMGLQEKYGQAVRLGSWKGAQRIHGIPLDWTKRDWVYTRVRGRFLNRYDEDTAQRVVVLIKPGPEKERLWMRFFQQTPDTWRELFDKERPLGREIFIDGNWFKVVGVLEEPPEEDDPRWGGSRWRPKILMPLSTMLRYFTGDDKIASITVDVGDVAKVPEYEVRLRALFKELHRGEEDIDLEKRGEYLAANMEERKRDQVVFLVIGLISLLAGGIGIMNVSLATVFARIKEIGIRRAVGATRTDIIAQFVLESIVLASLGGLFGVLLGGGSAYLLPEFTERMETKVELWQIALCFGISVLVGFVFSVYPAYKASRLDPVEALGHE